MITRMGRNEVEFEFEDEHRIVVGGEHFVPEPNQFLFVLWRASVEKWKPPFEQEAITPEMQERILQAVKAALEKKGWIVEIE